MNVVVICLVLIIAAAAGCHSGLTEKSVPLADVLAGPYELRLAVRPQRATPGEHVTVGVEFKNTGTTTLWIPRERETSFAYEGKGSEGGYLPPSACDGLRHVKVSPGKIVRYEKDFVVPPVSGEIRIYIWDRRDISVPLEVTMEHAPASPPSAAHR